MKKNIKKVNTLIKKTGFILELEKEGISRASPSAFYSIERAIKKMLERILVASKEEMLIAGRKTLKEEDVRRALEKMREQQTESWEL